MSRSSLTEETPAAPGWLEDRARRIFREAAPGSDDVCNAYLDCLAGVRGGVDVETGHDGCRQAALAAIPAAGQREALGHALLALEAELSQDT